MAETYRNFGKKHHLRFNIIRGIVNAASSDDEQSNYRIDLIAFSINIGDIELEHRTKKCLTVVKGSKKFVI